MVHEYRLQTAITVTDPPIIGSANLIGEPISDDYESVILVVSNDLNFGSIIFSQALRITQTDASRRMPQHITGFFQLPQFQLCACKRQPSLFGIDTQNRGITTIITFAVWTILIQSRPNIVIE